MSIILEETNDLKLPDLNEKELKTSWDYDEGPMWRIKVLKMMESDNNSNKYTFILSTNHAISYVRNGYTIAVQFMDL